MGESTGQKHSVLLHVEDPKCKMLLSEKQIFCCCCCLLLLLLLYNSFKAFLLWGQGMFFKAQAKIREQYETWKCKFKL